MSRRIVAGAAAGTALVLSLTGCMGDSGGQTTNGGIKLTAAEAVAKTSQKTGQADSFKADLTVTGSSGAGATKIHATGQFRTRPALAFTARLDQAGLAGRSLPGVGGQAVFVDDMLYVKSQQLSKLVGGKPWMKIDVKAMGRQTGVDAGQLLDQVQKVDPAEQTKMFTASKDVRTVGQETIDGVKTTHYAGTVTVDEALKQFDAAARAKLQRVYPESGADQKISFDLWTDGDQLPRKLVSRWDGTKGENGSVTILYRDYGKAVKVTAPPARDVQDFDLGDLLGGRAN
ncbi:LppX_LprAFG lipoprotein [Actinomadura sp. HBU206391]|uniref:LppX_LprAFG lipoprotein n=1 Tax=Actinomadura sp. HBU206391 TaxID=2731692 RepID=UPI00164FD2A6|nr:LppX_LprAFG lipoprotein [Actinomadura sp. HBU206391]MBC6461382.1 LppX_LprAFG lipoprotein [Actinomadura sp. HBU206391]